MYKPSEEEVEGAKTILYGIVFVICVLTGLFMFFAWPVYFLSVAVGTLAVGSLLILYCDYRSKK